MTPRHLLTLLSVLAVFLCLLVIYVGGPVGVYALVGISGCMSLMFPTIYGIALDGLFTAVWVNGRLGTEQTERTAQLSDGSTGFAVRYSMRAHSVVLYRN